MYHTVITRSEPETAAGCATTAAPSRSQAAMVHETQENVDQKIPLNSMKLAGASRQYQHNSKNCVLRHILLKHEYHNFLFDRFFCDRIDLMRQISYRGIA